MTDLALETGKQHRIAKLAICVTFHYNAARLEYLQRTSSHFRELADEVVVTVVTNTARPDEQERIRGVLDGKGFAYSLFVPSGLGHPFLLTWSHFVVFREQFPDPSYSHFLYVEDDLLLRKVNIDYWLEGREILRSMNFIPSFFRVERKDGDTSWYSSDCPWPMQLSALPRLQIGSALTFVNARNPYQGLYLLDRELMAEHLNGVSSNPDFGPWRIREKATQGLTYLSVPKGFISRNLLPYLTLEHRLDERCFIHHTPNNYANAPADAGLPPLIRIQDVFTEN